MKILHIGNVANNAYVNAKLLNDAGYDSDVICPDYYHIMGTPEWEDADFKGQIPDEFFPNWNNVNLRGFSRPKWFAQGPLPLCIDYLIARRTGSRIEEKIQWWKLTFGRQMVIVEHSEKGLKKLIWKNIYRFLLWLISNYLFLFKKHPPDIPETDYDFDEVCAELIDYFKKRYPNRKDQLSMDDLGQYRKAIQIWHKLLHLYDIVQAYGTEPIIPLLAQKRPYIAYEHGTIRERPFIANVVGRLLSISYPLADAIHMTNADSVGQALYLQPDTSKIVFGLHGLDEKRIQNQLKTVDRSFLNSLGNQNIPMNKTLFLSPARHNWELKGTGVIIHGIKELAKKGYSDFLVLLVEWGQDIELSKRKIDELGIADYICWCRPLNKEQLVNTYQLVDAVLDQFTFPAIGGITPEVLSIAKCPVITYVEPDIFAHFYGEPIPVLSCKTPDELSDQMIKVIAKDPYLKKIVSAGHAWFKRHHSRDNVLRKNLEALEIATTEYLNTKPWMNKK